VLSGTSRSAGDRLYIQVQPMICMSTIHRTRFPFHGARSRPERETGESETKT
jgi:hypothetical protein